MLAKLILVVNPMCGRDVKIKVVQSALHFTNFINPSSITNLNTINNQ